MYHFSNYFVLNSSN